ncbi:MAG: nucleotidyltransferase domain-containing protein [Firmicutes bacterium]|nr:nucleotidyltransferase domain-containing protein [Bacillota bacterium]
MSGTVRDEKEPGHEWHEWDVYIAAWKQRLQAARKKRSREAERALREAMAAARFLVESCGARRVYLFGSLAWKRPFFRLDSDIDLAVEGMPEKNWSLAERGLGERLSFSFDLVDLGEAAPFLRRKIETEGVLLCESGT